MSSVTSLPKYSQIHQDESDGSVEQPSRLWPTNRIKTALFATALSALAFGIILLLLLSLAILLTLILPHILQNLHPSCSPSSQGHSKALQPPSGYKAGTAQLCGNSPAEASAAGCVFDLMTVSWLPLECYDGELTTQFMEEGPWNFYLSNSTRPEALPEESSLATYHHTEHCSDTLANTSVPLEAVITRVELSYPAC
ncbi:Major facilitator superfamily transporter [Pyrenophora seminiperda CCB06]|uniref:Major facilitator superfamily transporter n=1 Tax=Pyrenophora seminiperda CCB06 TaxID=1302712 RepID=A0A3M7MD49_9PLEO|nr:Major facilitator superfamily transporter [Pyrenophora seminiperda CCB06]